MFNYLEAGFAKYQTPRAWLSTWSGHASRAAVLDLVPKVTVPTLIINYTGDHAIYPDESRAIFDRSPAADKQLIEIDADHFGNRLPGQPDRGGRDAAMSEIGQWLRDRFPAR